VESVSNSPLFGGFLDGFVDGLIRGFLSGIEAPELKGTSLVRAREYFSSEDGQRFLKNASSEFRRWLRERLSEYEK
jgi:hypothetical protein